MVYHLPASVPFWSALLLGLDFTALDWLIWLEFLPRGLLLCLELLGDKEYRDRPLVSRVLVLAVVLLAWAGAMAFVAMFLNEVPDRFALLWRQRMAGVGAAVSDLVGMWRRMGVLLPLAVATAARVWRLGGSTCDRIRLWPTCASTRASGGRGGHSPSSPSSCGSSC